MKKLKRLILDQPISSSVDRATWWIEYVIRNEGTKHLNNKYKSIPWYQYLMLDVAVAVIAMSLTALFAFAFVIQKIRKYSKSLPFEKVTRGGRKCKML
jgi:glucuronosyltransferase